jgi:hypothetical protein
MFQVLLFAHNNLLIAVRVVVVRVNIKTNHQIGQTNESPFNWEFERQIEQEDGDIVGKFGDNY